MAGSSPVKTDKGGNRRANFADGPGMRRFIVGFFAVIGFVTVLFVAGVMLLVGGLKPSVTPLPGNILLTVNLTRDLPEGASEEPILRLLAGSKPSLRDFLDAIEAAGN